MVFIMVPRPLGRLAANHSIIRSFDIQLLNCRARDIYPATKIGIRERESSIRSSSGSAIVITGIDALARHAGSFEAPKIYCPWTQLIFIGYYSKGIQVPVPRHLIKRWIISGQKMDVWS